ncbi:MAG: RimJ/RimL family protein N-acetyltransferase [Saprospiraceae bacterium]|jgi:RimJ/RimL family protein N-acetyltransferase|tara:strand:+ start:41 stop:559 length:519 start_codon:yes stop_codon:yes gene_type:complete
MPIIAETERLILRKIKLFDASAMFEMDSNPNVLKYLTIDKIKSIEVSKQHILNIQYQYEKCGVGRLAVVLKSTDEFIGWSGLKYIKEPINNHKNIFDLGYRFLERHWGKGYATEAAQASLDYGFNTLNLKKIHAITMSDHTDSQSVLKKIGFQFQNIFSEKGFPHHWYSISN